MRTLNIDSILANANRLQSDKHTVSQWYGMNSTYNFGCMTYLYKKYNNPKTVQEFFNKYISDTISQDNRQCGRNYNHIINKAKTLASKDNFTYSMDEYIDFIIKKLFIDTFNGCQKEVELKELIEKKGFTTKQPSLDDDLQLGIDLFAYKDGKLKFLIQTKPITFFLGNRNLGLINDRVLALQKQALAEETYKVKVIYCIYNKDKWIKNNNGGIGFKLERLIENDGFTKNKICQQLKR